MTSEPRPRRGLLRAVAVFGLLSAALFIGLPLLGCAWNPVRRVLDLTILGWCVGLGGIPFLPAYGLPGFTGPYWGNLIAAVAYLVAAAYVAISKRP